MAETLISPGISTSEIDQSTIVPRPLVAGAAIVGPTVKGPIKVPTKVTSYSDYVRTFGTTFPIVSGSITENKEFLTSIAAKNYFERGGDSLLVVRVADSLAFSPAESTTINAKSGSAPFKIYTLSEGALMNSNGSATYSVATADTSSWTTERFTDQSLVSGSVDNLRFEITNVSVDKGTFNLSIRRGDDTKKEQIVLENYNNLSLDPNSSNYIAKVIGDQYTTIQGSGTTDVYLDSVGTYVNNSKYVRVEVLRPTLNYLDTAGNYRPELTGSLPVEQRGAFQGGTGNVGVCYDSTSHEKDAEGVALYFENIKSTEGTNDYNQSIKVADYQDAIDLLSNTDEYAINVVSAPGLLDSSQIDNLISVIESRGDCISVVDLVDFSEKNVSNVAAAATEHNSSYAATYWPYVQMYSSTGRLEWCPASTVIPGIYTYSDHQAAPWYAPAGMTRGGVQGVVQTARKLTKAQRDILYAKNVNPIASMPGAGLVVYGQKTLQKKTTALDRVNVRRLLIEIKSTVKEMASGLLFEQNTQALQNSFRAQLDPYLASLVQRNGLTGYSIDLSGNTSDAIDRNEFLCYVALQPTKTIEFVYLKFTVTATGVSFE